MRKDSFPDSEHDTPKYSTVARAEKSLCDRLSSFFPKAIQRIFLPSSSEDPHVMCVLLYTQSKGMKTERTLNQKALKILPFTAGDPLGPIIFYTTVSSSSNLSIKTVFLGSSLFLNVLALHKTLFK